MTTITRKLFAFVNMESVKRGIAPQNAISISELDYRSFETLAKDHVFVSEHEINVLLPDNIAEISADKLVDALAKMRAEHHQAEQALIDTISSLRMLAAPKEGELVDDSDLVVIDPAKKRLDDGAQDAEFNEIPF